MSLAIIITAFVAAAVASAISVWTPRFKNVDKAQEKRDNGAPPCER